ncbi:MAG: Rieske (2Fe-2S) protein [Solirubrobacteraceae bacterium]|nr:Rieske (2Fe-2S) protein [Solirubrobacteraceae bacterium]
MSSTPGYVRVGDSADIAMGSTLATTVGDEPVCVVRVEDGLFAFDDVCPHRGAALSEGKLAGTTLTCSAHTWEFDVRSGELLRLRAPVCLTMREVREEDGVVLVAER